MLEIVYFHCFEYLIFQVPSRLPKASRHEHGAQAIPVKLDILDEKVLHESLSVDIHLSLR